MADSAPEPRKGMPEAGAPFADPNYDLAIDAQVMASVVGCGEAGAPSALEASAL